MKRMWILTSLGYIDAHRKTTGVVYSDQETTFTNLGGQPVVRWLSFCKIGECDERFPHPGYGMERGQKFPASFMRKKVRGDTVKHALRREKISFK
jgi:hypothetical protein